MVFAFKELVPSCLQTGHSYSPSDDDDSSLRICNKTVISTYTLHIEVVLRFKYSTLWWCTTQKWMRKNVKVNNLLYFLPSTNAPWWKRTEPCVTPERTLWGADSCPETLTICFLLVRNSFSQASIFPRMPRLVIVVKWNVFDHIQLSCSRQHCVE